MLITRFNLRWGYKPVDCKYSDAWMRDRINIFERYTLPSVMAQHDRDFVWVILLDEERCRRFPGFADSLRERGCVPLLCDHLDMAVPMILDFAASLGDFDRLATSRLDCDDMLHPRYFADVKAQIRRIGKGSHLIDFPFVSVTSLDGEGYGMRAYWRFPSAFLTLVEPFDQAARTAIGFNHYTLRGVYPEHLLEDVRTMIVTHGGNVRNRFPSMLRDIAALMWRRPMVAAKLAMKWAAFDAHGFAATPPG